MFSSYGTVLYIECRLPGSRKSKLAFLPLPCLPAPPALVLAANQESNRAHRDHRGHVLAPVGNILQNDQLQNGPPRNGRLLLHHKLRLSLNHNISLNISQSLNVLALLMLSPRVSRLV